MQPIFQFEQEIGTRTQEEGTPIRRGSPGLRILVVGPLDGQAVGLQIPRPLDIDHLDALPGALQARCEVNSLEFATFEDFHPDQLLRKIPETAALLEALAALKKGEDGAAKRVAGLIGRDAAPVQSAPPAPEGDAPSAAPDEGGELMANLLGQDLASRDAQASASAADRIVEKLLAQSTSSSPVPLASDTALKADAETWLGERLRQTLHAPAFQALEAAWLGAALLPQRLETGEELTLQLASVSLEALRAWAAEGAPGDHPCAQLFNPDLEGADWDLVCLLHPFTCGEEDGALLAELAQLGPTCVAGLTDAEPDRVDGLFFSALHRHGPPKRLALAAPRLLLRMPYGEATEELDTLPFEEGQDHLLWGSAAPALALALIRRSTNEAEALLVDDLPMVTREDGEQVPCAERWTTRSEAEQLAGQGLCVLQSIKHRNAAQFAHLQNAAGDTL